MESSAPGSTQEHQVPNEAVTGFGWGRFWLVFLACFGLLLFRGWDRISHPELFAESMDFMGDALNYGWASLFGLRDAMYQVATRLVAITAAKWVPIPYIPLFTNAVCYAVAGTTLASLSRPVYRWIIPSDGVRALLCLMLCLVPGLNEVLGNLANLHRPLLILLAILALKDPKLPYRIWELVVVALIAMTAPAAVVFLPLAFLRLMLARGRHALETRPPALSRISGELIFFTVLLVAAILLFANMAVVYDQIGSGNGAIVTHAHGLGRLLPALGALFATFYVLHPFLGTENTSEFLVSTPFYPMIVAAVLIVALMLVRLWRQMDYRFWVIPAWLGSMLLVAVMLSIVRYWVFYGMFSFPYPDWWFRYNFTFAATGLVLWFILLRVRSLLTVRPWTNIVFIVLVVGYVSQATAVTSMARRESHRRSQFPIYRYEDQRYWSRTAAVLERSRRTGCPASVVVSGPPRGGWQFVYHSPVAAANCPE